MDRSRFAERSLGLLWNLLWNFKPLQRRLSPLRKLPATVGPAEGFTRFLLHKTQFAASTGRVKPTALEPRLNEKKKRYETSTHRTDGLESERIWTLGYEYVEDVAANRQIRGRAIGVAAIVTDQNLDWVVNGSPYPRHADLIGWLPGSDKNARMLAAIKIAQRMRLELDPRP